MEFTDEYFGRRISCPKCQHSIVLPALPKGKMTSSLRLVRPAAPSPAKFQFSFASIALFLREFKHWKIVGLCLLPFILVAGALVAASRTGPDPTPAPAPAPVAVKPQSLDKLTELTRADQLVRDRLDAVNRACTASQTAEKNQAALHSQHRGPGGPGTSQAVDQAVQRAHQDCANARKSFDTAFAQYQKLGGTIDYRRQLPQLP
jgi:hypothetical protein